MLIAGAVVIGAPAARAQWSICNETSFIVETAFAYDEAGKRLAEGWRRIRPGACEVVKREPLTPGDHFFYARASNAHRGGLREWSGRDEMCVDASDFSIAGEATNCDELGFQSRMFVKVGVDAPTWQTRLEEVADYAPEQAAIAGVQRLLLDAGYADRLRIDGDEGRTTRRLTARFLTDVGAPRDLGGPELVDLLEKAARERASEMGLRLCNRAETDIWAAVARRADDTWESRGWWLIAPDACATVFDQALDQPAYYVYAATRSDGADTPLAAADETFCLAETRFAILGRENCRRRGYSDGRFLTVLAGDGAAKTIEFAPADFRAAPEGLRR